MNRILSRFLLLCVLGAAGATLASAAETKAPEKPKPSEAAKPANPAPASAEPVGPVVVLTPIQVSPARVRELDKQLIKLEKQIAREQKAIKSSELDKTINSAKIANAAALFGGNSSERLAAIAASRIALMEQERIVLEGMKRPRSKEELDLMETELEQLRTNRRNLDNAPAQR